MFFFFVSAAILQTLEQRYHGREASHPAYKFETRGDLLLGSYLNIAPICYQKNKMDPTCFSCASSSQKKNTFEDADMLAVFRKLQVQGYMSGNLYFSK